jgi:hypothetical protein
VYDLKFICNCHNELPLLVGDLLKIYWKNNFSTERTDTPQILIVPTNKNTVDLVYGAWRPCSWYTTNHDKRDKYDSVAGE